MSPIAPPRRFGREHRVDHGDQSVWNLSHNQEDERANWNDDVEMSQTHVSSQL